jgi:hypothetical protein
VLCATAAAAAPVALLIVELVHVGSLAGSISGGAPAPSGFHLLQAFMLAGAVCVVCGFVWE